MGLTKIAIIEDDQTISQMYRMKFEAEGFDVQLAGDGESGVALVKSFDPDFILLDMQMPVMTGDKALALIRAEDKFASTPVLVLTNMGKEESPKELEKLNIAGYIVKAELTPSQVVARVKQELAA